MNFLQTEAGGGSCTVRSWWSIFLAEGPFQSRAVCLGPFPPLPAWESATWCQLCSLKRELALSSPLSLRVSEKRPDVGTIFPGSSDSDLLLSFLTALGIVIVSACFPLTNPSEPLRPENWWKECSTSSCSQSSDSSLCQNPGKLIFINRYEFVPGTCVFFFNLCIIELEW